ncbi:MAG TPA: hypothetical protein VMX79_05645 [bacterium]|nr:hypothetical protein [bacterium]
MRKKVLGLAALLATCVATASAAMLPITTAELAGHATLVVAGTVQDVTSYPPDAAGIIYSEAEVRVSDVVVGATAAEYVTVRYIGGEYAGLALVIMEEPTFEVGEDVVVFLAPAEGGGFKCPDGAQGKMSVVDGTVLPAGKTLNEFFAEVAAAASR